MANEIGLQASQLLNYASSGGEVVYFVGFAEAIFATSMHPTFPKAGLILAPILAATPCLHACTGWRPEWPRELEPPSETSDALMWQRSPRRIPQNKQLPRHLKHN